MKRRAFTKLATLSAVAVSTHGFLRFNGKTFEGDCETTTDILGPFYRPDSPVRNHLVIESEPGDLVELSGVVRHKDCRTPYQGAKVELWHCSADEVYDNDSDEFRYRGTTFCDAEGRYHFTTQMPVPYDAGGGRYRPAHFHLLISAPNYQSLITQIYFTGDPYLEKDSSSVSPKAAGRILKVQESEGMKKVVFDINMNDKLMASTAAIARIVGRYVQKPGGGQTFVFFEKDRALWMENEVYGLKFDYIGNNTFSVPGLPGGSSVLFHFDLKKEGEIQLTLNQTMEDGVKHKSVFIKSA